MGSRCLFVTLVNGNRREPSPPARTIPFIVVILRYKSLLVYHRSPVPSQSFECVIGSGSTIHAAANSSEAVENLIRVNSWNSWRIYWPRSSRKRSLTILDVIDLKYNFSQSLRPRRLTPTSKWTLSNGV